MDYFHPNVWTLFGSKKNLNTPILDSGFWNRSSGNIFFIEKKITISHRNVKDLHQKTKQRCSWLSSTTTSSNSVHHFWLEKNRQNKSIYNGFFVFKCVNNIIELIDRWKHHSTTAKNIENDIRYSLLILSFQEKIPGKKLLLFRLNRLQKIFADDYREKNWQFSTSKIKKDYHH